jgi:hypothetical protein
MLISNIGNTILWQQCMSVAEDYRWAGYGVGKVDPSLDLASVFVNT